ncbi:molybdopterin-guanine dinucleotide biosynthesis protein B [Candidatus Heimdallarchaeota archaeon]|nr:MAG: molybdopterin-guanine dinucleotide biosynthesis protein B [Candidatus Gerdarchaeota archaeon]RLI74312.1 MAG: molybdopterin-guanine dinucleotide biosynthesis protein B [Candidatus Heimdallarchaeota archaeon]
MKIFTIIGYTDSGKTSTLIKMIEELVKRGFVVNTVKKVHIENFTVETEGKDSWLHRQAGATITVTRSNCETAIMFQRPLALKELIPFFSCDYLILEGFTKEPQVPKILCAKSDDEIDDRFDKSVFAISGVISNKLSHFKGVEVINGLKETKRLVDLAMEKAIDGKELL